MEDPKLLKVPLLNPTPSNKGRSATLRGSLLANDSEYDGTSYQQDETLNMDIHNKSLDIDVQNKNFTKAVRNNLMGDKQDLDMAILPFKPMSEKQL